jgi:hypothetical protein
MEVVGSDGEHVGTVDHKESADQIILTKEDPNAGGCRGRRRRARCGCDFWPWRRQWPWRCRWLWRRPRQQWQLWQTMEPAIQRVHAVVVRDFDRARESAKATDIALTRGGADSRTLLVVPRLGSVAAAPLILTPVGVDNVFSEVINPGLILADLRIPERFDLRRVLSRALHSPAVDLELSVRQL